MYFPTICVDDFFRNPDEVRNFALSLDYKPHSTGKWPGKRSEFVSKLSPQFYHVFCQKFFSLSYDKNETLNTDLLLMFSLIEPDDVKTKTGWIHQDDCAYAGLIYLNPKISLNCGTSIFRKKDYLYSDNVNGQIKSNLYLGSESKEDIDGINYHNSKYEETIKFGNIYNRMIAFDSHQFHSVNHFSDDEKEPRLTLLFFINWLRASRFPIPESRTYSL